MRPYRTLSGNRNWFEIAGVRYIRLLRQIKSKGNEKPFDIMGILCNCQSEISNVCNSMEGDCLQAMKIVHHHANGCFDWLVSGQQSVNPSREVNSILSGKYKRFTLSILWLSGSIYIQISTKGNGNLVNGLR